MQIGEATAQAIALIRSLLPIVERLVALADKLPIFKTAAQQFSYENLLLDLTLDIKDSRGQRAVITRKQRVCFLSRDAGVLTNPIWGDGEQVKRYDALGAIPIGERAEGGRKILFLALPRRPEKGDIATVVSRRTVANGFLGRSEYFDIGVERSTGRLSVRVLFPKRRPPSEAVSTSVPLYRPSRRLPVRFSRAGRPQLSCTWRKPPIGTTLSVRWSW